jgi:hypothetical protein
MAGDASTPGACPAHPPRAGKTPEIGYACTHHEHRLREAGRLLPGPRLRSREERTVEGRLYDSRDLTTHAVCVGMTGSGKTGLCLVAARRGRHRRHPGHLHRPQGRPRQPAAHFPAAAAAGFPPWVDPPRRAQGNVTRMISPPRPPRPGEGPRRMGPGPERIQRSATRGRRDLHAGQQQPACRCQILRSFAAPPPAAGRRCGALRDRIMSAVSGLLGCSASTPTRCRAASTSCSPTFSPTPGATGAASISPGSSRHPEAAVDPHRRVRPRDVLPGEGPARPGDGPQQPARLARLRRLDGRASRSTSQRLLFTRRASPRISILSIAHLSDAERMFFVTLLLNEWSLDARQSGTSSLRALLYMDEIFGYFPPVANPPSKRADAHAAEAGARLRPRRACSRRRTRSTSTTRPLQHRHLVHRPPADRARQAARARGPRPARSSTAGGRTSTAPTSDALLSALGNRVFLMRNVHEDAPVLIQTAGRCPTCAAR